MKRLIWLLFSILVALGALPAAVQARGTPPMRCFEATAYCISGPIQAYWEKNGGLAAFGYPITEPRAEDVEGVELVVQWFERDRLEIQPNGTITAGRLGARYLELQHRPWQYGPPPFVTDVCSYFPQTGYQLCGPFREYWQRNGGLERFGYPITDQIEEVVEGRVFRVQYFERRRMEFHPEYAGTRYEILLGLLGQEIFSASVCPTSPTTALSHAVQLFLPEMGCPFAEMRVGLPAAAQRFERGVMLWIQGSNVAPALIYILSPDPITGRFRWQVRVDTFQPGDRMGTEKPPAGLVAPANGFGKIWWNDPAVRQALGWASEPEQKSNASLLLFPGNGFMLQNEIPGWVVVMRPSGIADIYIASLLETAAGRLASRPYHVRNHS
jgi:hypothetical protein